ncbi:aminoglycoside N(3)-acetyltransferase [Streptomyces sp. ST1015]|uniref:aminoglycoside N(3)-acetyltransferase n=1 Tax=unclassified Streptomyces TaxID=2593676 RepID=UPI001CA73279|nr:AAC(3) family N-acetyltransferase [Streptomyces sp. ST1015]QZZ31282.1 AAC(3) family N-acetyltransferase [Streptomyces sp. ST1015]
MSAEFARLGVRPGATVLVHASLRRVGVGPGPVLGALLDAVGPRGTVVVPTFTAGNSDTSPAYKWETLGMTPAEIAEHRARMPAFDPDTMASQGMGRLAEAVRRSARAVRSAHPQTSFAAIGARARELMAGHDEECHLGERSPLARLEAVRAQVLLLGVGFEVCSAFHLGEARVPGVAWRTYGCVVRRGGVRTWVSYEDVAHDDRDFGELGAAFEADTGVVRRGRVGGGEAALFPLDAAVAYARTWLAGNRAHGVSTDPSQDGACSLH